jgi:hypothetical protein
VQYNTVPGLGQSGRAYSSNCELLGPERAHSAALPADSPSMRDHAVALASDGFRVFKLVVNGKTPAIERFYDIASKDEDVVHAMWTDPVSGDSLDNNVGILTGDGLVVLDVDTKDGKPGLQSLEILSEVCGLEKGNTRMAKTASGGVHLYYGTDQHVPNSASKLGPGLDVRGHHGFVVAPGSTVPGGDPYRWLNPGVPVRSAPAALCDLCAQRGRQHNAEGESPAAVELDEDGALDRARVWLAREAPEAIEGAGGNDATFRVACRVKDFGVGRDTAAELMAEWNETKAYPPWAPDELYAVIEHAYQYGQNAPGSASAHADFEVVEIASAPPSVPKRPQRRKLYRVGFAEAAGRALSIAADPLIKGLLTSGGMSVLYGKPGSGKTFVALDLAYHVAAGLNWNGRRTKQAPVVYLAAEAGGDIYPRIEALKRRYTPPTPPPLDLVPCSADLFDAKADLEPLIALIEEAARDRGQNVALVVIDTLARVMVGGDENSTMDMGVLVANVDRIRAETGGHVLLVHHSGKDTAKGARGSSALVAATDTEIEVADHEIRNTKQRSSAAIEKHIKFDLLKIEIGVDADGDPVTSCTVALKTASEFEPLPLNAASAVMKEAAEAAARAAAGPAGDGCEVPFSRGEWEKESR